jgi:hypothetical protein
MIGLFSIFDVMEPQGNYMEELYGLGECKLTWMICYYFSCIARPFCIYIKHAYFGTLTKYILELFGNSLLQKRLSINKIIMSIMRLVKLCM